LTIRISAGILSPAFTKTTSPGTRSFEDTLTCFPPLTVFVC
jgi:hypothetical protein